MSKDVLVLAESDEGELEDVALEMVSESRQLADALGVGVSAAVLGKRDDELSVTLASYGADRVYFLESPLLAEYSPGLYIKALVGLLEEEKPDVFLCGAGLRGHEMASGLAARLGTGLVNDCIGLALNDDGLLQFTKLTYGGKLAATFVFSDTRPQIATITPGTLKLAKPDKARKAEIVAKTPKLSTEDSRCKVVGFVKADPDKLGLDEAEVIVAGGRGMESADNFQLVNDLARRLSGVVGASLGAIDEGWVPHKSLIGQTGMTVSPRLYVACGISGSNYHVLGMRESKVIIAINKDRNAPIFKSADMGMVGDATELLTVINSQLDALATGNSDSGSEEKSA